MEAEGITNAGDGEDEREGGLRHKIDSSMHPHGGDKRCGTTRMAPRKVAATREEGARMWREDLGGGNGARALSTSF